jgi:Prealbumin-like fold domain
MKRHIVLPQFFMYLAFASSGFAAVSLSGKVVANGAPLGGATIYTISERDMGHPFKETIADDNGYFEFSDLPEGKYFLEASKAEAGYPYSIFSFYIMPGQRKPKVEVIAGKPVSNIVIDVGAKAAHIQLRVSGNDGVLKSVRLVFSRPDLPGDYKRSFSGSGEIMVPPVPFRLSIEASGYAVWTYMDSTGGSLIKLKSGDTLYLDVKLQAAAN